MKRGIFHYAWIVSLILFVATLGAIVGMKTIWTDPFAPWENRLSLNEHLHLSTWNWRGIGRLVITDHVEGPYLGSVIPLPSQVTGFNRFGVYYRVLAIRQGPTIRTIAISYWYPLILFGILPGIALWRRLRQRPIPNHCSICGYDLRASGSVCPECGAPRAIT